MTSSHDARRRPRTESVQSWLSWIAAGTAVLLFAGCWYDGTARELEPAGTAPVTPDMLDRGGRSDAGPERRTTPDSGTTRRETLETPGALGAPPAPPELALMPGGMRVAFGASDDGAAHLQLTVRHRGLAAHRVAIAEIAADYITDVPLAESRNPSLRRAIADLGGTLTVEVDPRTTRFVVTAPREDWRRVLQLFGTALSTPPTSNDRVAESRDRVLRALTDRLSSDPLGSTVERVRSYELEGVSTWLAVAEDATLGQVAAFWRRSYVTDGCVLAARVPDVGLPRLLRAVDESFADWVGDQRKRLPATIESTPPAGGLFWAAGPDPARTAIVLMPAPIASPLTALEWIAIECLTADGVGGRIGSAIQTEIGTEPGFAPRIVDEGTSVRIELRGELPSWAIRRFSEATQAAFQSLADAPPSDEAIRRAAARARLRLFTQLGTPKGWMAWATHAVYAGLIPNVQWTGNAAKKIQVPGADVWETTLATLSKVERAAVAETFRSFADRRSLVVVVGGNPDPAQPTDSFARVPDAFVAPQRERSVTADEAAQLAAATALKERAIQAVGGPQFVALARGLTMRGLTRSGQGPELIHESYYAFDGRLHRMARVLATEIETLITPEQAYEAVLGRRVELSKIERASLLAEYERHPLMLLGAWLRGEASYRLLSMREAHGREIAILERRAGSAGRLKIHVDTESGLIRVVESEDLRTVGLVYLREEYGDYRTSDVGARVPHRRVTYVDDGLRGLLTEWTEVQPVEPAPEHFTPR